MLLYGKVDSSSVNGPGERCVIWFSGCTLNCPGCWNPDTHIFDISKKIDLQEIYTWLSSLPETLEGITFSGGDPMQHAEDTMHICFWVLDNRPNWTIGMFTGYTFKEMEEGRARYYKAHPDDSQRHAKPGYPVGDVMWNALKGSMDFAIMGRYNKLMPAPDDSPLVTTSNQELKLFSDRYTKADFAPKLIEITIDDNGLTLTGFPVGSDLSEFKR